MLPGLPPGFPLPSGLDTGALPESAGISSDRGTTAAAPRADSWARLTLSTRHSARKMDRHFFIVFSSDYFLPQRGSL